jgi:isopentenyl phosphate kinase
VTQLLFLKLGGSLITDKRRPDAPRHDVIRRLAREVGRALSERDDLALLIGHGSGSFGHYAAQQYNFAYQPQTAWEGFVHIGAAAARLNRLLIDTFLDEGIPVFPIQPSATALSRAGQLVRLDDSAIQAILQKDCVPLVYGDVCLDEERGWTIISTEQILAYLTPLLKPRRILLAGEVSGVYSGDPTADPDARPIPEISAANLETVRTGLTGADGYDVTGGMLTKVESMVELVEAHPGLEVGVISGLERDQVYAALLGQPLTGGTVIRAE